jgi:hypothetical protein
MLMHQLGILLVRNGVRHTTSLMRQRVTVLGYDVDGLVVHHEHELESKLIFGWTTSK